MNKTPPPAQQQSEEARTGMSVDALRRAILDHLHFSQMRTPQLATRNDWYMALAYAIRDRLQDNWIKTISQYGRKGLRAVGYLSAEFLLGPHLANHLQNLGIRNEIEQAVSELGLELKELIAQEEEPGLGNGGLGRLAACYLDSLATLEIPAIGYGLRYEFGIFDQTIRDGWQVEITDKWLQKGNPWEMPRAEVVYHVNFGGHTEAGRDEKGQYRVKWIPSQVVKGIAYDTPISGYRVTTTNLLRLWKSEAVESFDFEAFNVGDYYMAVEEKVVSETLSKVLYPNDEPEAGKRLRLMQQYFFVSCSLQDMIRLHSLRGEKIDSFHETFAAQLNDTHPAIAVAELMRLLIDEHGLEWERAWQITRSTFAYTNHTLLPEALEKWPLSLFASLLPRPLEIIYEINRRFLDEVKHRCVGDEARVARLSLIDESGEKYVRMANLASAGCFAINGVAALHTELLKQTVLRDFYEISPEKFHNVTNGVTPRRWMVQSNPGLSNLITRSLGEKWPSNLENGLRGLERFVDDAGFQEEWQKIKIENKRRLAALIKERAGIVVDHATLFDIQVKRFHEYKRQHLNMLHVISLYNSIKREPRREITPRTVIFGGKAAPGYFMAKLMIKLINAVAEVVNADPQVNGRLKVVFFPDFNVKNSEIIYPAADLSEQISTAGKEASGTGNMKFAMNGALTIGTLDGANVEIREEVGPENFFLFGLTVQEVHDLKARGYSPPSFYESNPALRETIDQIAAGAFSRGDRNLFKPLVEALLRRDEYMLLVDYQPYLDCQARVSTAFRDRRQWARMSILNAARMGKFSSDRAIREYSEKIWGISWKPKSQNSKSKI